MVIISSGDFFESVTIEEGEAFMPLEGSELFDLEFFEGKWFMLMRKQVKQEEEEVVENKEEERIVRNEWD